LEVLEQIFFLLAPNPIPCAGSAVSPSEPGQRSARAIQQLLSGVLATPCAAAKGIISATSIASSGQQASSQAPKQTPSQAVLSSATTAERKGGGNR